MYASLTNILTPKLQRIQNLHATVAKRILRARTLI
jgi:hypothetical protein